MHDGLYRYQVLRVFVLTFICENIIVLQKLD